MDMSSFIYSTMKGVTRTKQERKLYESTRLLDSLAQALHTSILMM